MDEFEAIAQATVTEEFERLTKAVNSLTGEQQAAYAETYPIRIWTVVDLDQDNTLAISVN